MALGKKLFIALALAALMVGAVACGDDEADPAAEEEVAEEETPEEPEAPEEVTVSATEYAFSMPTTLPAGTTPFILDNVGKEPHFISIVELQADAPTVEELLKLPEKKAEAFFVRPDVLTTKPIQPGEQSEPMEAELTPGRYGYVCFFATKGEPPHALQGMFGEFTVE